MEVAAIGLRADGVTNINQAASSLDNLSKSANKATKETSSLTGQQKQVPPTFDRSSKSVDSFAKAARRAGGVVAAAFSVRAITRYADSWTNLNSRIELSIDAQEDAADVMGQLSDIARQTYSDLSLTADAFIRNSVSLSALGKSTQEQIRYTSALNNALALSGAEGQRAESVQMALTRAMSEGALRGEDLNNVLNYGSRISQVLADSMGVTVTELKRLGAQGEITGDILFESLIQNQRILEEEYSGMGYTIGAAMRVMSNSILETVGALNEQTGGSEAAAKSIAWLADAISDSERLVPILSVALQGLAVLMAGRLVGGIVASTAATNLYNASLAALTTRAGAAAASVSALNGAFSLLGGPAGVMAITVLGISKMTRASRTYAETTDLVTSSVNDMTEAQLRNLSVSIRSTKEVVDSNIARLESLKNPTTQHIRQIETQTRRYKDLETQLSAVNAELNDLTSQRDLENFLGGAEEAAATFERWDRATKELVNESGTGSLDALFDELEALGKESSRFAGEVRTLMDSLFPADAALREMEGSARILDRAFQDGLITIEQYVQATDLLTGAFHQAGDAAVEAAEKAKAAPGAAKQEWRGFERFLSSAFMTMGDDADDAWDRIANSFSDMLTRMVADAAASGILSMFRGDGFMSGFMGGDMGSLLGGLFGGGGSGGGSLWNTAGSTQELLSGAGGAKGLWSGIQGGMSNALSGMASAWPLAVALGMVQSGKLYGQGVRPDASRMADASQWQRSGSLAATAQSGQFEVIDSALTGLGLDGKTAAILSGSTFHQALWEGIYGAILGGPKVTRGGVQLGFGGQGANFSEWANITDSGGIFSGTSRRIETSRLDSEFNKALHQTYNSVIGNVMGLYEQIGIAVDESALRGVEIATKRIGAWGKSEQTEEEIAAEITAWFGDLQDAVLQSVIPGMNIDTLRSWGALRQQSMFDPLQAARGARDFAENNTLLTAYGRSTDAVMELRNAFDGSIESANILNQALQIQQQSAFDLATAYLQAQSSVNALFMGLSESIRTSLMSQEELYNYQRDQVHALGDALHTMTDPQRIMETAESIEQRISRMWGRLDEDQAEELGPQYLTYIEEINRVAQRQLEQGLSDLGNEQTDVNRSIQMAIQESANVQIEAANQQAEAARMNIQAAQMNQRAMAEMAAMFGRGQQMEIAS